MFYSTHLLLRLLLQPQVEQAVHLVFYLRAYIISPWELIHYRILLGKLKQLLRRFALPTFREIYIRTSAMTVVFYRRHLLAVGIEFGSETGVSSDSSS